MEELLMLSGVVAARAAVATGVVWMAWRWVRGKGRKAEQAFQDQMTRDVAELLCRHLPSSRDQLEAALIARLERGEDTPLLDGVLRVECLFGRTPKATVYSRKVSVLVQDGDDVLVLESSRDVSRERLPQQVRAKFIHSGSEEQAYVILDHAATRAGSGAAEPRVWAGAHCEATNLGDFQGRHPA
jgi:hypothetical protein